MNLDQDIRTMLQARTEGVTAAPMIPPSTLRRVRARKTLMIGSVAAVVVALVFGGLAASRSLSDDAAPIPPADETTEEDPTVDGVSLDTTFVSPRNGFSIKHPDRAALTPAKQVWWLAAETGNAEANKDSKQVDDGFDVVETGLAAVFKGSSTEYDSRGEGSVDEQVDEYLSGDYMVLDGILPDGCGVPRSEQAEITIDGQSGRISECESRIEATVVFGGRLYLFTLEHDRTDARAVFDAFAATIDLTPETAIDFPAMTTTFVSPTYGYSFKYFHRGGRGGSGGLAPATQLWDPVNQQSIDDFDSERAHAAFERYMTQFDRLETGLAAYFSAASTEIPTGVSIEEWVDDYVLRDDCGVPRSQQAEITIDGKPGRVCDNKATVVAGGRLYLFTLGHDRTDGRAWFDAWIDTIELTPETAAVP